MIDALQLFYEQLKYEAENEKLGYTAEAYHKAAAVSKAPIEDIITIAQFIHGLDLQDDLKDLDTRRKTAEQAAQIAQQRNTTLASIKTALDNAQASTQDRLSAIEDLLKDMRQTSATGRKRIATTQDIYNDLVKYDPDHDFTTTLFDGLRCPNGSVTIIAARPAGGKTSAMINATREALYTPRSAFFVNLEMNRRQIYTNLCLSLMYAMADDKARIELNKVDKSIQEFNHVFKNKVLNAHNTVSPVFQFFMDKATEQIDAAINSHKLFIYDGVGNTLEGITADISVNINEGDVVLLDYMQRTPPPRGAEWQSRQVQIQEASRALLNTALESQCVIIAGAQVSRDVEKGSGKEATQADMRESGDIENDAHNIIVIEPKDGAPAYLHPVKAREGGQTYERMALEAVKNYVYWTGTSDYKSEERRPRAKKAKKVEKETPLEDIPVDQLTDDDMEEYDDGFNEYRRQNNMPIPMRRKRR